MAARSRLFRCRRSRAVGNPEYPLTWTPAFAGVTIALKVVIPAKAGIQISYFEP